MTRGGAARRGEGGRGMSTSAGTCFNYKNISGPDGSDSNENLMTQGGHFQHDAARRHRDQSQVLHSPHKDKHNH